MERFEGLLTNRYLLSYAAAVLLHLLLFWLQAPLQEVLLGARRSPPPRSEASPLAFEFVEVPRQEHSEVPPEKTPLRSDRQSVARDLQEAPLIPSHLPYSEGKVASKDDLETVPGAERKMDGSGEGREGTTFAGPSVTLTEEGRLAVQEREEAVYGRPSVPEQALKFANRASSALRRGGMQLSTYDWNFAPYAAYLKRRIEGNIYPPPAFTSLGLIQGRTRLRFKILKNGTLQDLEVLGYDGSSILRDTSLRAVNLSARFRPLPDEFPEDYLEITGIFDYVVVR